MPIDHVTGWLYRVARNRITDLFRARRTEPFELEDLLPSPDDAPEAEFARGVLIEALEAAIAELPAEQRDVFIAHELEGRSFKEMSAAGREHPAVAETLCLRLPRDHAAAGIRSAGPMPDAVWRLRWRRRRWTPTKTHDSGGEGTPARPLLQSRA